MLALLHQVRRVISTYPFCLAKETQHTDLHCGDYNLVGADLRQWSEFKSKLESVGVDSTLPTLFLAE